MQHFFESARTPLARSGVDYQLPLGITIGDLGYSDIYEAISNIGETITSLRLTADNYSITTDLTIPDNVTLILERGAIFTIATGKTLTINGGFEAGLYQVFSCAGTGKVVFGAGSIKEVYLEWWGGANTVSVDSTASLDLSFVSLTSYGTIRLLPGVYKTSGGHTLPMGITIQGSGTGITKIYHTGANVCFTSIAAPTAAPQGLMSNLDIRDLTFQGTASGLGALRLGSNHRISLHRVNGYDYSTGYFLNIHNLPGWWTERVDLDVVQLWDNLYGIKYTREAGNSDTQSMRYHRYRDLGIECRLVGSRALYFPAAPDLLQMAGADIDLLLWIHEAGAKGIELQTNTQIIDSNVNINVDYAGYTPPADASDNWLVYCNGGFFKYITGKTDGSTLPRIADIINVPYGQNDAVVSGYSVYGGQTLTAGQSATYTSGLLPAWHRFKVTTYCYDTTSFGNNFWSSASYIVSTLGVSYTVLVDKVSGEYIGSDTDVVVQPITGLAPGTYQEGFGLEFQIVFTAPAAHGMVYKYHIEMVF